MISLSKFFLLGGLVLLTACPSEPPVREMVTASAAFIAAKKAEAEKKSPDLFGKAENQYWKAKRFFLAKEYDLARQAAIAARRIAEQAEMDAELRMQTEESF